jgi:hypothetical protein
MPFQAVAKQVDSEQRDAHPLMLEEILTRVHENFRAYLASLPNLFADEHLDSSMSSYDEAEGHTHFNSTTESAFRLERSDPSESSVQLIEARQILSVDRQPVPAGRTLAAPDLVTGAFSYGGSFLSPELKRCYDYRLLPSHRLNGTNVLVVEYALKLSLTTETLCPVHEQNTGRAYIDPISMQVVRFEQVRPHHELDWGTYNLFGTNSWATAAHTVAPSQIGGKVYSVANRGYSGDLTIVPGTKGKWSWAINYAPIVLNGKTFWLPTTITSSTTTTSGRLIIWTFDTKYSNYHLLTTSSKILPGYSEVPQQ